MKLVKEKKYRIGLKEEYAHLFPYFSDYMSLCSCVRNYHGAYNHVTLEWMKNLHDIMFDNHNKMKRFVYNSLDEGHTRDTQMEGMFVFGSDGDVNFFFSTLLTNESLHYLCDISQED
jgi:hypothetical protein